MIKHNDSNMFPLELYHLSNFHLVQAILPKIQQAISFGKGMERSAKLPSNVLRLLKRPRHLGHAESQSNIQGKCRRCKFSSQPQVSNPGSNKMAGGRVCSSRCEILRFKDVKIPSFFSYQMN